MKTYEVMDVYIHIFITSPPVEGEWLASRTGRFTPGKEPRYPLDRKLGGSQSRHGRYGEVKILNPTGTRTPNPLVVQPIASRNTDCATAALYTLLKDVASSSHYILRMVGCLANSELDWAMVRCLANSELDWAMVGCLANSELGWAMVGCLANSELDWAMREATARSLGNYPRIFLTH
jgi:hypothetical protein